MEFIQQNILLVVLAFVSGSALLAMSVRGSGGHSVTASQATMLINRENALLIDLREANEYLAGHLTESRNIPAASLEQRAGELSSYKDTPVILVCQSGARSTAACSTLRKLGFNKVHSLEGGVTAWLDAGLPLKKCSRK